MWCLRRLRLRGRCERGQALPMTIGVMLVLGIAAGAVMTTVSSSQTATKRDNAREKALSLAEAGLNNGLSVLYATPNPLDPTALGSGSGALNGGTSGYTASLAGSTWTITGIGTTAGTVGGAGVVRRSVSLNVTVGTDDTPWHFLFADTDTGCFTISNNADIDAPIYSRGDLCIGNNAHVNGDTVQVEGKVTIGNNGSIGTLGNPVDVAKLAGCASNGSGQPHPCSQADRVYATSLVSAPSNLTKPTIDLSGWYTNAEPGPTHNCTTGSVPGGFDTDTTLNRSRSTFQ